MRFAVATLCCFIAGAFAPAGADESRLRLEALLARVRSAVGRPYLFHLSGFAREGSGPERTTVVTESQGTRGLVRRCNGELCSGTYFDGADVWFTNLNGTAVPAHPDDPRRVSLRAIESGSFSDPEFERAGGRLALRVPLRLDDGRTMQRIAVTPPGGATLEALIDPETGLVGAVRGDGVAVAFSDQRAVGELTLPFEISSGAKVERFEQRSIEAAPLEAPRGLVPRFTGGDRSIAPFLDTGRPTVDPVVECVLGTERVPCLFDTGNSGLSISLELAERLKLEPLPDALRVSGLGGYETGVVRGPELRIGDAVYPQAYYAVLHDIHAYGYDLVLGTDALAHALVTIDYPARKVTLEPERSAAPLASGIALSFENFLPIAQIRLSTGEVRLAIDTGDESAINLAGAYYRLHPDAFTPETHAHVAGVGGTGDELLGTIDRFEIGGYVLKRQPIGSTNSAATTADGHLGSGALRHFAVTLDYANRRVGLRPRPGDPDVISPSSGTP
jgi:hypothetical protein